MLDQIRSQAETLRKQDIQEHKKALYDFVWNSIKEALRVRPGISSSTFLADHKVIDALHYFVEQALWNAVIEEYKSKGIILDFNEARRTLKISWN